MSNAVFPTLAGQGWSLTRTPQFKTRRQQSISGKSTVLADQAYPIWQWQLVFNLLRQGVVSGTSHAELATLLGFYNERQGGFDSFLYSDADDDAVTNQEIGITDGVTQSWQLVRAFGGFVEPVLAPNAVSAVSLGGALQSAGSYSVAGWGTANPGTLAFASAPAADQAITVSFTYYWPCRFVEDKCDFEKFMAGFWQVKKLTFASVL